MNEQEDLIAELRARVSHVEAERDQAQAQLARTLAKQAFHVCPGLNSTLDRFDELAADLRVMADKCSTVADWDDGWASGMLAASERAGLKARLARRLIEDRPILDALTALSAD